MTLGAILRADDGGLGTISWEFARHMKPDKVLLVDMGSLSRGKFHPERFDGLQVDVTRPLMNLDEIAFWLRGVDNVFGIETFYDPRFDQVAQSTGVHRTLYVMPELFNPRRAEQRAERYFLACEWDGPNGEHPVLPMPVALDRFDRLGCAVAPSKRFFHLPAPAMEDRNGTEALLASLPYVDAECELVIAGSNGKGENRDWHVGNVTVTWLAHAADNYWDVYPDSIDAFVLPRRYGALSLPLLEAAACGLPIISTCLSPQSDWLDTRSLCSCKGCRSVSMKGGWFDVWEPNPVDLATRITRLASDADLCVELAEQNRKYAEAHSWANLRAQWEAALR